jgi:hypothetical protein
MWCVNNGAPLVHHAGEKLQESNWIDMLQEALFIQSPLLILICFAFLFFPSAYPQNKRDDQVCKHKHHQRVLQDDCREWLCGFIERGLLGIPQVEFCLIAAVDRPDATASLPIGKGRNKRERPY